VDNDKGDKSLVEKTIEAVKDLATSVTDAAKHAMEPEPIKPEDELVVLPMEGGGLLGEPALPQYAVIPRKKSRAEKASKKTAKKTAKKVTKKIAKKSAKKTKSAVRKKKAKTPNRTVKKKKKVKRG
jgi:hypothetical protein